MIASIPSLRYDERATHAQVAVELAADLLATPEGVGPRLRRRHAVAMIVLLATVLASGVAGRPLPVQPPTGINEPNGKNNQSGVNESNGNNNQSGHDQADGQN